MTTRHDQDHVVVGAGVVGAATARALARAGARVLLVERGTRGHDRGSSHGASRIVRRGYVADDWVAVGTHGTGREVHPDARLEPSEEGRAVLREYVAEWVPGVDVDSLEPISCLYDTTPTEDPVLDRVGAVTVATGFSGHGFKFGPTLGALLAGVATGTPAPERFRLRGAGGGDVR